MAVILVCAEFTPNIWHASRFINQLGLAKPQKIQQWCNICLSNSARGTLVQVLMFRQCIKRVRCNLLGLYMKAQSQRSFSTISMHVSNLTTKRQSECVITIIKASLSPFTVYCRSAVMSRNSRYSTATYVNKLPLLRYYWYRLYQAGDATKVKPSPTIEGFSDL